MKHIIFLYLETGGLNPALHQITQIAALAVEANDSLNVLGEPFERKISLVPGKWTQEALDKQGFSIPVWDEEGVPITKAIGDLHEWATPYTDERLSRAGNKYKAVDVGGHNVTFDSNFLEASAKRCGIRLDLALFTSGKFDTLQLALWDALKTGEVHKNYQLETLCKARGLVDFGAHDALEGVRATLRLARSFMAGF